MTDWPQSKESTSATSLQPPCMPVFEATLIDNVRQADSVTTLLGAVHGSAFDGQGNAAVGHSAVIRFRSSAVLSSRAKAELALLYSRHRGR
jgi:hypothetical protein